ncbi:MAG TPA: hypothetical protein VJV03_03370, partial [Pyrinomonadaceae bacterium]|nr:hypothetical protein [Pyrinomonadaceae bacterium]
QPFRTGCGKAATIEEPEGVALVRRESYRKGAAFPHRLRQSRHDRRARRRSLSSHGVLSERHSLSAPAAAKPPRSKSRKA